MGERRDQVRHKEKDAKIQEIQSGPKWKATKIITDTHPGREEGKLREGCGQAVWPGVSLYLLHEDSGHP